MFLYSETINAFRQQVFQLAKGILQNETPFTFGRRRIEYRGITHPFEVVVFEHQTRLGFYDPQTFQIGLNKSLMYLSKKSVLKNIIRHELAHLLLTIVRNDQFAQHGPAYRQFCQELGWGAEVYSAKMDLVLENEQIIGELKHEAILIKVQKLLKLADSSNEHEAGLATAKANELLLKYNLQYSKELNHEHTTYYVCRVLSAKRNNTKLIAISRMLKEFLVSPVFNHTKGLVYLEVTGTKLNVELAQYVASFLDHKLDQLWSDTKKNNPHLKGLPAKNSYILGVAKGFKYKMVAQKSFTNSESKSLVEIQNHLKKAIQMAYGQTSALSSQNRQHCQEASNLGQQAGHGLTINPAFKSKDETYLLR